MADPDADAERFLRGFHARDPGATRRGFGRGRLAGGGSSYHLLAATASSGGIVLDLGCGDGALLDALIERGHPADRLLGVDLSAEPLAAARPDVTRLQARAQALPLRDRSIDAALAHLSLMLMPSLDPVIAELTRVLRPGAVLAAIVGGGPRLGDAFERFVDLLATMTPRPPRLADPRLRSTAGIAGLLAGGFDAVTQTDHDVDLSGPLDDVWATLATSYELAPLSPPQRADLRTRFAATCAPGPVPCTMHVRLVTAIRNSSAI